MARSFWWPSQLSAQVFLLENFIAKIATYQSALGWNNTQTADAIALCNMIINAINTANQCRATAQAVTNWRDIVLYGEPKGQVGPTAPVFPIIDGSTFNRGTVDSFFELRDQIVANNGYSLAMGEDLGLVGAEQQGLIPADTAPELKTVSASANMVTITGSMQGLPVMRVEYAAKGQTYGSVAIVTNLPATFEVPMADPDNPEVGTIRSIFVKKNADFGNYSPNYDVTLA
ncbi:MAG TPA: hypothetical protein PKA82_17290 [Pyrinomonadaceae bacterium]|nr:hypothetical protein [Pyrinomonadaceae bacterium]